MKKDVYSVSNNLTLWNNL